MMKDISLFFIFFEDPLELSLNYSYNLNVLSEVSVTNSYLSLEESVINCQEKDSLVNCITKNYINNLKKTCRCLPLKLGLDDKVREKPSVQKSY